MRKIYKFDGKYSLVKNTENNRYEIFLRSEFLSEYTDLKLAEKQFKEICGIGELLDNERNN